MPLFPSTVANYEGLGWSSPTKKCDIILLVRSQHPGWYGVDPNHRLVFWGKHGSIRGVQIIPVESVQAPMVCWMVDRPCINRLNCSSLNGNIWRSCASPCALTENLCNLSLISQPLKLIEHRIWRMQSRFLLKKPIMCLAYVSNVGRHTKPNRCHPTCCLKPWKLIRSDLLPNVLRFWHLFCLILKKKITIVKMKSTSRDEGMFFGSWFIVFFRTLAMPPSWPYFLVIGKLRCWSFSRSTF